MSVAAEAIAERLYEWSLQEAGKEVERKFSLSRLVKGTNAEKYVRFFGTLAASDLVPASQALAKRMNQPLLLRQAPALTEAEAKYVYSYLTFEEIQLRAGLRAVKADASDAVWTVELRKALKSLVKERFRSEAGKLQELDSNEWVYEEDLGAIRVRTWLDFGGRSSLSYSHMLVLHNDEPFRIHLSLLQWLGAASMTRWRTLRAEELLDTADAVMFLTKHFLSQMTLLFQSSL